MSHKHEQHPNLTLHLNGEHVAIEHNTFPGGETFLRINSDPYALSSLEFTIHLDFRGNSDLIDLLLLTDAVRRHHGGMGAVRISLVMNYFPYARQDRVCTDGEPLSVKVIADLINSQGYEYVECMNLHSDVSAALVNRLSHRKLYLLISRLRHKAPGAMLVSPDAGAAKKTREAASYGSWMGVIYADKVRDPETGDITGTTVHSEHLGNQDLLIVDDICDGGRTFIELAKELRKITTGKLFLYVTHGIFSNGADVLTPHFDRIFTSNLMGQAHPNIEEI